MWVWAETKTSNIIIIQDSNYLTGENMQDFRWTLLDDLLNY